MPEYIFTRDGRRFSTRSADQAAIMGAEDLRDLQRTIRKLASNPNRDPYDQAAFERLCARSKRHHEAARAVQARAAKRSQKAKPTPKATPTPTPKATTPVSSAPVARRSFRTHAERLDAIARSGIVDRTDHLSSGLLRDLAMRDIDSRQLPAESADRLEALVRNHSPECDGALLARHIVVTGRSAYRSAWLQSLSPGPPAFDRAERQAIDDYRDCQAAVARHAAADTARQIADRASRGDIEVRAADEGTGSAGGFGVPYYLDPSLVVVAGGVRRPQLLTLAKNALTTTDNYHFWTAASTGFATAAEAAVAADEAPTFAGVDIPIWKAVDAIPYSFEFGLDQPDWADNAVTLFSNAYAEYLSAKTATGSGSSDIRGVFTALQNSTTSPAHIVITTAGTLGVVDLRAAWTALPERYRVDQTCAWMMSPSVEQQVAALAAPSVTNGLGPEDFVTNRTTGQRLLFGRPVMSISDAPAWTGTSGSANVCVVGAFSSYCVAAQVGGYQVELVDHLFDQATGRPSGQRAFLATARVGADVVDPNAFRLLANS